MYAPGKSIHFQALRAAVGSHRNVAEVRGVGLMAAVEFMEEPAARRWFDPMTVGPKIAEAMARRGVIARAMPEGNIIGFAPPLCITRAEVDVVADALILGRDDLRRVAPYLSDAAIGAGFCGLEGKANPLRATPAIAAAAERAGAAIFRETTVTGIAPEAAGYRIATTRGTIRAARVVNAAGAAAGRIARMVGLDLAIDGFPLQVTVTEPIAPLVPHLVYSAAGKLSLKQAANGGCIIGGGWPARVREGRTLATDPRSLAGNMVMAAGVVPALAVVRAVRSWTAWVNGTPDWRPIIGEAPGHPGFILALFPWVGFSAGPITGRIAADLALGKRPTIPLDGISVLAD